MNACSQTEEYKEYEDQNSGQFMVAWIVRSYERRELQVQAFVTPLRSHKTLLPILSVPKHFLSSWKGEESKKR